MLTLAKILVISILFSSLLFGIHGKKTLEINATESTTEGLKTVKNKSISLEREANVNSDTRSRNTSNPKTSNSSLLDSSNKIHELIALSGNLSTHNTSGSPGPTSAQSTSSPLIHSFVSKLPLNSSGGYPLVVSASPNATATFSLGTSPWFLANDSTEIADNSSVTVALPPPEPTTKSLTPLTMEPTGEFTTSSDSFAGFTPYQEITTPQPTLKFTNNSKLFPSTSDPQEENRKTGVVFGAILGAILGASLLSLVGYLLCGKRKTDSFSHRRLYDDRNEPVLRLDNAPEPYDMSFGNSSYYNPSVNDTTMPEGRENACDSIPMDSIPPLRTSV
ncbi:mucin-15 [Tupaia chinensis]|uniref:mucin-15 n=1 Tax=Tupaia chinensis TaxID=246437 RepID=UPI0003C90570|nr:mucin-15 [Tupaia chinensis]XP_006157747.1 mucin-15 [Tupaia chinensis]